MRISISGLKITVNENNEVHIEIANVSWQGVDEFDINIEEIELTSTPDNLGQTKSTGRIMADSWGG